MGNPKVRYPTGHRERFCDLIEHRNYRFGVEVGVNSGSLSRRIWARPCIEKLYLVDPWSLGFYSAYFRNDADIEACYQRVQAEADQQHGRVKVIREPSLEAVKDFKDDSLDFVFIDGLHDYKNAKADFNAWLPKIRNGGLLAGDDYHHGGRFGVREAACHTFLAEQLNFIVDSHGKPRVFYIDV